MQVIQLPGIAVEREQLTFNPDDVFFDVSHASNASGADGVLLVTANRVRDAYTSPAAGAVTSRRLGANATTRVERWAATAAAEIDSIVYVQKLYGDAFLGASTVTLGVGTAAASVDLSAFGGDVNVSSTLFLFSTAVSVASGKCDEGATKNTPCCALTVRGSGGRHGRVRALAT